MVKDTFTAGNKGSGVRSDCFAEVRLNEKPLTVSLESKVEKLYGDHIRDLAGATARTFGFDKGEIVIIDSGALDFVLAARLEAAIKLATAHENEYLPEMRKQNTQPTQRDTYRISRLYLPGNSPKLMLNAGVHDPDGIILDLEDSVAPEKKYEARFLVRNALRSLSFYGAERMVRINQLPEGLKDLPFIVPHGVNVILLPKCESAEQVVELNKQIRMLREKHKISCDIWVMPIIESALGVEKAYEIATSSDNVVAMAIGLEDYTADMGTSRSPEGMESFYARSRLVNACRAANIQPIDSVFSDIEDMEALKQNVLRSRQLGFEGMGCIHPRQLQVVKQHFAPSRQELEKALKIWEAFKQARAEGKGVVALGSKMIDPPVVKRAGRQIELARRAGMLKKTDEEEM
ncbi:MAG: aldolase/citrate lyase family protein [Bacteroidales bacterium]